MVASILANPVGRGYSLAMSGSAEALFSEALDLTVSDRLKLASELLASVDGPPDPDWDKAWLAELDRRMDDVAARDQPLPEWTEVRASIFTRLSRC